MDRSTGKVAYFRLYLPSGPVNFDVNRRVTECRHVQVAVNGERIEEAWINPGDEIRIGAGAYRVEEC